MFFLLGIVNLGLKLSLIVGFYFFSKPILKIRFIFTILGRCFINSKFKDDLLSQYHDYLLQKIDLKNKNKEDIEPLIGLLKTRINYEEVANKQLNDWVKSIVSILGIASLLNLRISIANFSIEDIIIILGVAILYSTVLAFISFIKGFDINNYRDLLMILTEKQRKRATLLFEMNE